jgi:hypothetical protein
MAAMLHMKSLFSYDSTMRNAFRMAAGILGWAALLLQYVLVLTGTLGADSFTRSINFFSFNTIITNIMVALALTLPIIAPQSALGQFSQDLR